MNFSSHFRETVRVGPDAKLSLRLLSGEFCGTCDRWQLHTDGLRPDGNEELSELALFLMASWGDSCGWEKTQGSLLGK